MKNAEDKKNNKKRISPVLVIVLIICLGVFAFSAYKLIPMLTEYIEGDKEYSELSEIAEFTLPVQDSSSPEAADIGDDTGDHGTGNVLFHELDALIAGLDIHAGVTVAVRITTHMLFSLSQFAILSGRSHGGHSFPVQQ